MEMQEQQPQRRPNPRRRQRSRMQIFKEAYLPVIILALTVIFILVCIIGSAIRGNEADDPQVSQTQSTAPSSDPQLQEQLAQQVRALLAQAELLAQDYNYAGAIALLEGFQGDAESFPELTEARENYLRLDSQLVSWDPGQVTNLAFHMLIADSQRAFQDKDLGKQYQKNFLTLTEFKGILQQLYARGYVLVDLQDLYTTKHNESTGRDVFQASGIRLPQGKKPLLLTEVNAGYYDYMYVDGGDGFASRLCWDGSQFYAQMKLSDGSTVRGSFDMVPVLEEFLQEHPDFSYRGARATIAITGSDSVFGYDVQSEATEASQVVQALKDTGYTLACYTYGNVNYGTQTAPQIQSDLQKWTERIAPIVGDLQVMVFARDADIGDEAIYNGSKYTLLYNAGFRYFMGVSQKPWNQVHDLYVRHNRLMVTGQALSESPDRFSQLFDAAAIKDPNRP